LPCSFEAIRKEEGKWTGLGREGGREETRKKQGKGEKTGNSSPITANC